LIYSADEIYAIAARGGAIIRSWGATHLLRDVPHVVCVRVCAPFELRKTRMMQRLASEAEARVAEEIRINDEAHAPSCAGTSACRDRARALRPRRAASRPRGAAAALPLADA
jgi:hypothetical protein